jgi:hypothetical protein
MDRIIQPEESGWEYSPFLKQSRFVTGCVVRVGEETLSSMVWSIFY